MFRSNEVTFLIGAGCSVQAKVPSAKDMILKLEERLLSPAGADYEPLYSYLKGALIQATYIEEPKRLNQCPLNPDIERLVVVLSELEKHHKSLLYPFIGSWAPHLIHVTKNDFALIWRLKNEIINQLKDWVKPDDNYKASSYYKHFFRFQKEYNYPLRVFSLNYDLCFEENTPDESILELGFNNDDDIWDGSVFSPRDEDETNIYLYKLHGSMDWQRDETQGTLRRVTFPAAHPDLIFGIEYKMQFVDPYLFYAHEFRRYTREAKVVISIGYSFRDPHINGIIHQALLQRPDSVLLVLYLDQEFDAAKDLGRSGQIKQIKGNAKDFLDKLTVAGLYKMAGFDTTGSSHPVPF